MAEVQTLLPGIEPDIDATIPDDVAESLRILSGDAWINNLPTAPAKEPASVIPGSLQAKFFEERSKTHKDYTISDMKVRVFDLANGAQADSYSEFVSEHFARMMSNPEEYRFTEVPAQIVPHETGVRAVVIVKAWKQTVTASIKQPSIDKIPRGGLKRDFQLNVLPDPK